MVVRRASWRSAPAMRRGVADSVEAGEVRGETTDVSQTGATYPIAGRFRLADGRLVRLLLSRLLREAVQRRLRVLEGHVLYDNTPMLRLLRTSGQPLEVHWDGGDVLSVQLAVPAYAAAAELLPVPAEK